MYYAIPHSPRLDLTKAQQNSEGTDRQLDLPSSLRNRRVCEWSSQHHAVAAHLEPDSGHAIAAHLEPDSGHAIVALLTPDTAHVGAVNSQACNEQDGRLVVSSPA